MPKSTKATPGDNQASKYTKPEWCRYELAKDEEAALKEALMGDGLFIAKAMNHLVSALSCKVQLDWDFDNQCCVAFIYPQGDKNPNFGMALSGHGSRPHTALAQAYWKSRMMSDKWIKPEKRVRSGAWDDDLEY